MRNPALTSFLSGLLCAASLWLTACGPKPIPVLSVEDLMEDRVTLDGVLLKCNQNPAKARNETECRNARVAVERLAHDADPATEAKRVADFERRREQLRLAQEQARQVEEAKTHVDPYSMPVVPVEPAAAPPPPAPAGPPSSAGIPPAASQPKP